MSDDRGARNAAVTGGAPMVPSRWYGPFAHAGLTTTNAMLNNRAFAIPFPISRACVLTGIAVDVTVTSEAGGLVRLGVYSDSGGMPGVLVQDAGTIDATIVAATPAVLASAVQADWYWAVAAFQSTPTTRPTVRAAQQGSWARIGDTVAGGAASKGVYIMDGVSGALPANFAASGVSGIAASPYIWLKA